MASFTIKFTANLPDDYKIGWRSYVGGPYETFTMTITEPGDYEYTVQIPGSLYCAYAGIEYEYWVIARCQGYTPVDVNGKPEDAVVQNITIPYVEDPYQLLRIRYNAAPIGDFVGNTYCASCDLPNGTYAATITAAPGTEVSPANILMQIIAGNCASITAIDPGLYTEPPVITFDPSLHYGSCSTPADLHIFMVDAEVNLNTLSDGNFLTDGTATWQMKLGDEIVIVANYTTVIGYLNTNFPGMFTVTKEKGCHCCPCQAGTLELPVGTGVGYLLYNQCWDLETHARRLVKRTITEYLTESYVALGCIIAETVNIDNGSTSQPAEVTFLDC